MGASPGASRRPLANGEGHLSEEGPQGEIGVPEGDEKAFLIESEGGLIVVSLILAAALKGPLS